MKKNILLFVLVISIGTLSACTLGNKNFSLGNKPEANYGEEVYKKIEKGEYQYRDESQAAEEMELVMPVSDSTEIEDIESELETLEILEEDFSDI